MASSNKPREEVLQKAIAHGQRERLFIGWENERVRRAMQAQRASLKRQFDAWWKQAHTASVLRHLMQKRLREYLLSWSRRAYRRKRMQQHADKHSQPQKLQALIKNAIEQRQAELSACATKEFASSSQSSQSPAAHPLPRSQPSSPSANRHRHHRSSDTATSPSLSPSISHRSSGSLIAPRSARRKLLQEQRDSISGQYAGDENTDEGIDAVTDAWCWSDVHAPASYAFSSWQNKDGTKHLCETNDAEIGRSDVDCNLPEQWDHTASSKGHVNGTNDALSDTDAEWTIFQSALHLQQLPDHSRIDQYTQINEKGDIDEAIEGDLVKKAVVFGYWQCEEKFKWELAEGFQKRAWTRRMRRAMHAWSLLSNTSGVRTIEDAMGVPRDVQLPQQKEEYALRAAHHIQDSQNQQPNAHMLGKRMQHDSNRFQSHGKKRKKRRPSFLTLVARDMYRRQLLRKLLLQWAKKPSSWFERVHARISTQYTAASNGMHQTPAGSEEQSSIQGMFYNDSNIRDQVGSDNGRDALDDDDLYRHSDEQVFEEKDMYNKEGEAADDSDETSNGEVRAFAFTY